jgi:hypothetical protein
MSNIFDKILTSVPVNKQAAAGGINQMAEENELVQLQRKAHDFQVAIKSAKNSRISKDDIYQMGIELNATNTRISEIKGIRKHRSKASIPFFFVRACEEEMSGPEFRRFMKLANQKLDAEMETEKGNQS